MYKIVVLLFLSLLINSIALSDSTMNIIKVNGAYGIADKGSNQGLKNDQILYVKRITTNGIEDICQVKIIRCTENRSAVEQLNKSKVIELRKGDRLYLQEETKPHFINSQIASVIKNNPESSSPQQSSKAKSLKQSEPATQTINESNSMPQKKSEIAMQPKKVIVPENQVTVKNQIKPAFAGVNKIKEPWISMNMGSIFPSGQLAEDYSTSLHFSVNYMVSVTQDFNIGLEVSNSYLNGSQINNNNLFSSESTSMFSSAVLFQKFFGHYFFIEAGGGIFRPKIKVSSIDNVETSYSETYFGIVGGGGFYLPTSEYAGFAMKGRLHNYFDHYGKYFLGVTGGFRFKIR